MTTTEIEPEVDDRAQPRAADTATPFASLVFIAVAAIIAASIATLGGVAITALITRDADIVAATPTTTLNATLNEFAIEGDFVAPAGRVQLNISNEGSLDHNVFVRGTSIRSQLLGAGGSALLDLGELEPGVYTLYCDVAGHESSGMSTELTITEASAFAAGEPATGQSDTAGMDHDDMAMDGDMMDMVMIESMLAFPAETEGRGNQPLEFELLPDGTKQFELTASIEPWERAPGDIVDAWTYNGQVPGPQIKVDVGDNVRVVVHNETPMGTDVHWHGIHTPNDQDGVSPYTQDPISSGDSFTYEFLADEPAIGMYHAHLHSQVSVPNGMFGSFIIGDNPIPYGDTIAGVEIPADLELAADIPMVINDAGVIGLTLNGKSFPATDPLVLELGDWAGVHYYNEGLTDHPMHLHQMPQLIYAKDGIPLDEPYWADTINVAPGERYSVIFRASDVGTWVWHCHILTHVEREEGMFGMVTAVVVTEPA